MFHARITLFKEAGREDRTSLTLNYFDVSRMIYFDFSKGRKDRTSRTLSYVDVSCVNHFDVHSREGGRTEHHGL